MFAIKYTLPTTTKAEGAQIDDKPLEQLINPRKINHLKAQI